MFLFELHSQLAPSPQLIQPYTIAYISGEIDHELFDGPFAACRTKISTWFTMQLRQLHSIRAEGVGTCFSVFYLTGMGLKNAIAKQASRLDKLYSQGQEGPRECHKAIRWEYLLDFLQRVFRLHRRQMKCVCVLRGHIQTICEKINVIMTLTPLPPLSVI